MGMTAKGGGGILSNEDDLVNGIPRPASPEAPYPFAAVRQLPLIGGVGLSQGANEIVPL